MTRRRAESFFILKVEKIVWERQRKGSADALGREEGGGGGGHDDDRGRCPFFPASGVGQSLHVSLFSPMRRWSFHI